MAGLAALLPIILFASMVGIVYAVPGMLRGTVNRATPIPFGTFPCLGGAVTLIFA